MSSLDIPLSTEEQAFRDEWVEWLEEHLRGEFLTVRGRGGPDDDESWDVRRAWEQELARGRWLGCTWPEQYGGRGANLAMEVVFQLEYARAGAPARAAFHGETLLAPTLLAHGTEEQRATILPRLARSEVVWCQGYSEPDAGSDLANIRTRARQEGDEWVVTGQKIWTTFAHHADWTFLIARTEPGSVAHAGLSYLLVPLDQAQVEVRPIRTMVGDSGFCEVFYEGARTPASNVVGAVGDGWRTAMSTLGHERATSVLGYQFAFEHELDALLRVAKRRQKLAQPLLRQRLAEAVSGLHILRWNTTRMLTQVMTGGDFGPEASIGKLYWSSWHQRFTELALDILGGDGVAEVEGDDERLLQRAFLRARAETIYTGTSEIQRNIIAERVLGLPREPRSAPTSSKGTQ